MIEFPVPKPPNHEQRCKAVERRVQGVASALESAMGGSEQEPFDIYIDTYRDRFDTTDLAPDVLAMCRECAPLWNIELMRHNCLRFTASTEPAGPSPF